MGRFYVEQRDNHPMPATSQDLNELARTDKVTQAVFWALINAADIIRMGQDTSDPPWDQSNPAKNKREDWWPLVSDATLTGEWVARFLPLVLELSDADDKATILAYPDSVWQDRVNLLVDDVLKEATL